MPNKSNTQNLNIKKVKDLAGKYIIPGYQRGYRWTEHEVRALLDDIREFDSYNTSDDYCLQPLILKKIEDGYEVVDGQQRLTTIYIILNMFKLKDDTNPLFELAYTTRDNTTLQTLKNIPKYNEQIDVKDDSPDEYYITNAFKAVQDWIYDNAQGPSQQMIVAAEIFNKLYDRTFFICHELDSQDAIEVFSRINVGKISLTNAELIKALFLSANNLETELQKQSVSTNSGIEQYQQGLFNAKQAIVKQAEIGEQWNQTERILQDDSFWLFLCQPDKYETRIELLFELLAKRYNANFDASVPYATFNTFYNLIKTKQKTISEIWSDVLNLLGEFQYWYSDFDIYHVVGFLVAAGDKIFEIEESVLNVKPSSKPKINCKSDIFKMLINRTKNILGAKNASSFTDSIDKLTFYDRAITKNTLLLFNIATLVNSGNKQTRFPFDLYKKMNWDLEHIHPQSDNPDEQMENDNIDNLCLLRDKINRSSDQGNKNFEEKRKNIREKELQGAFIPVCTRNVFMKYYTEQVKDFEDWYDNDKQDYIKNMADTLSEFWKKGD